MIKVYFNGLEFIEENKEFLESNRIANSFFYVNAKHLQGFYYNSYMIKCYKGDAVLLAICDGVHSLVIEGEVSLAGELASYFYEHGLVFKTTLANENLAKAFLVELKTLYKGDYKLNLKMDIMTLSHPTNVNGDVVRLTDDYIEEVKEMLKEFSLEALHKETSDENALNNAKKFLEEGVFGYFVNNKLVSIAKKSREEEKIVAISFVYTKKDERNKGYSTITVGALSNFYIKLGKTPYLYVDKDNPVSNHLYTKLGYEYEMPKYEFEYTPEYETFLVAGGCFWCMAKPWNEIDGVIDVKSGYAGGNLYNPTYEEVKTGETGHMEAVKIVYDPSVVAFKELLITYIENIDPFDGGGQFIDRGSNYEAAIFENNPTKLEIIKEYFTKIEEKYNKKVMIKVTNPEVFYMAEEYHQNFAQKNEEAFEHEEEISGRNNFEKVRLN